MKKKLLITLIILLNSIITHCQSEVCELPKDNSLDLNEISIKKCAITLKKENVRKITKTKIIRKRIINKVRKITSTLNNKKQTINLKPYTSSIKLPNLTKNVLFTLVEEIPMFESCPNNSRKENIKCFKKKINKHFIKHFYVDEYDNEMTNDKIFIEFSIDLHGKIMNPKIKSNKNSKFLHNKLTKIIKKLPQFSPGKEKGLPVIVTYSFPLNLTLN